VAERLVLEQVDIFHNQRLKDGAHRAALDHDAEIKKELENKK
jgi:hypothetical protein